MSRLLIRIGIDSYSYHRFLGDVRYGERPPAQQLVDGGVAVISRTRELKIDAVSLQTCFLPPAANVDAYELRAAAEELEIALSWGAPNGIEFGANTEAAVDLLDWLRIAARLHAKVVRVVAGGPQLRRHAHEWRCAVKPFRMAAERASQLGIELAVENHGELTAEQVQALVNEVSADNFGVCFDTANALRVGDDALDAASRLASVIRMVHLKDVEPLGSVTDTVSGPCSVPFGEGVVPLREVLDALGGNSFTGIVCVEVGQVSPAVDEHTLIRQSLDWIAAYRTADEQSRSL